MVHSAILSPPEREIAEKWAKGKPLTYLEARHLNVVRYRLRKSWSTLTEDMELAKAIVMAKEEE